MAEHSASAAAENTAPRAGGFVLLCIASVAAGAAGVLGWGWGGDWLLPAGNGSDLTQRNTGLALGLGFALAGLAGLLLRKRMQGPAVGAMDGLTIRVDALGGRMRGFELFIISLLALFLEVLLIRWHASELRAAAYFKNVTLLAAFLGLGLGFAAANRSRLMLLTSPIALAAQVIVLTVMGMRDMDAVLRMPSSEWIWGVGQAEWDWTDPDAPQTRYLKQAGVFYAFFTALFVSTILIFVPLGQITGRLMRGFSPIRAYTLNILGSLAGVVLFGLVSWLWLPPVVWFAIACGLLIYTLRHERLGGTIAGICGALLLTVVAIQDTAGAKWSLYTPYQRLEIEREYVYDDDEGRLETGVLISANRAYHLRTVNLADDFVEANGERFERLAQMAAAYDLPYRFAQQPERVLVVGAGGGNDVAAALRNGAGHVDAVEIDPGIVQLGKDLHAERPYQNSRVTVHVNDARAFMRHAKDDTYDLIVFGLLDSHTLLSGMSAVRLDNFVYTQESLNQARRLLKPEGTLFLSFATGTSESEPGVVALGFLPTRLQNMIQAAFGHSPRCFELDYDESLAFVAGRGASDATIAAGDAREREVELRADVPVATDDWPFLYLPGKQWHELPKPYFVLVGLLAVLSVVWILAGSGRTTGVSPHFFFLGGAFLLIEVKGITELALVYGTTWIVSSVVIAAILALILLANLFVTVFPRQNPAFHYAFLAGSLVTGFFIPIGTLLERGWWTAAIGSTALLVLPLFFAGVIFATSLKRAPSLPRAFSSNLLGAILGGLCEYSSMALGFRNLYLIGLVLYALSFLTMPRRRTAERPDSKPEDGAQACVTVAATGGEVL